MQRATPYQPKAETQIRPATAKDETAANTSLAMVFVFITYLGARFGLEFVDETIPPVAELEKLIAMIIRNEQGEIVGLDLDTALSMAGVREPIPSVMVNSFPPPCMSQPPQVAVTKRQPASQSLRAISICRPRATGENCLA